ncbi:MOB kinase activator-like 4 (Mob as tumor suppressor protein 4) (Dmob4) (Mps one binder kinase activator-like 4) [Durusdinium trenchii]|uniref:MOB kinase activator-like 4 (Mob as tumor suppressor protein 4) (Dmob4) (Mps one binder kinase activator-like 4) n=1 Tax=Durusdinium trenchii TaxID=1381693 RepID=A0ABP0RNX7_9DINO
MVVFTSEAKEKIISIFSRCYDDCMGSASFSHAADDIDRMSYQVAMIMGAERRVTLSQPTKAGTLLQSPKPGLPTLKALDASMVSCWETGHSRQVEWGGFRPECCSKGYARLFPSAEALDVDWEAPPDADMAADMWKWSARPFSDYDGPLALSEYIQDLIRSKPSDIEKIYELPSPEIDVLLWQYEHLRQFVLEFNLLLVALAGECTVETCPKMTASNEWQYLCAAHRKPQDCAAIDYIRHTIEGSTALLTNRIGLVSVLLCKLWAGAKVLALEPAPPNFRYLLWNLRINHVTDCVWPLNIAAGASPTPIRHFFYSPTYPTWSQHCMEGCQDDDDSWRGGFTDWQIRFSSPILTLGDVLWT